MQEYIQTLIKQDFKNVELLCTCPEGQDDQLWQYEQLRQFTSDINMLAAELQSQCACMQMKANEGVVYLCAGHKSPQECNAIGYILHTLDQTAALLNSNKWFPSRVTIPSSSVKYFSSIVRRLYRIFAHAYYHHHDVYVAFESATALTERFVFFSLTYDLIQEKLLNIPYKHYSWLANIKIHASTDSGNE